MAFVQEHYGLTVCSLFYGKAVIYTGQEERLKQRYVHVRQHGILVNNQKKKCSLTLFV